MFKIIFDNLDWLMDGVIPTLTAVFLAHWLSNKKNDKKNVVTQSQVGDKNVQQQANQIINNYQEISEEQLKKIYDTIEKKFLRKTELKASRHTSGAWAITGLVPYQPVFIYLIGGENIDKVELEINNGIETPGTFYLSSVEGANFLSVIPSSSIVCIIIPYELKNQKLVAYQ